MYINLYSCHHLILKPSYYSYRWFTVVSGTPNNHEHPANVAVNGVIDREQCSEVILIIMAVDVNTQKYEDSDNST